MQARSSRPWSCGVVGEVNNETLVEAAKREVHRCGVRAAPVRAWTRRCPIFALDRYGLAYDCGQLLADRSLGHLGRHIDQAHVLAVRRRNNRGGRVADTCIDVVPPSFVGHGPRRAVRRSRRQRRRRCPYRQRGDTRTSTQGLVSACPLKMSLSPQTEAKAPGATWSTYYTEKEAIEEKHLPTLVQLLTQPDSSLVHQDEVFALLLEIAEDVTPLSQVAQQSHLLDDDQFDKLIRRILASPGCGNEAVAIVSKANRLTSAQRLALRAKALGEASIATLLANAAPLRISDPDIAQLAERMRPDFMADPDVAVRALEVFGERLSTDIQRDAVTAIVKAKPSYALAALRHVNFSPALRRDLMRKVLSDARHDDFSAAGLSKEKLQGMLTPAEMRALIAMAIKRSETS